MVYLFSLPSGFPPEKEHKINAPGNGKERLFSYSSNLFTDSIQPLQVSQVHLTQFLFTALLLWVQTEAPKRNLIIPVGANSCTPQAVSCISSHIAPHYLCQAGMKGFGQQMKKCQQQPIAWDELLNLIPLGNSQEGSPAVPPSLHSLVAGRGALPALC